ncbi:MAG: multicopper oxidase domain-containing protein [Gemmatimonadota bacterium]
MSRPTPKAGLEVSRRDLLRAGAAGALGIAGSAALAKLGGIQQETPVPRLRHPGEMEGHGQLATVGDVDTRLFDPLRFLEHFDRGRATTLPDGRTLRQWTIIAADREIEVAPGVFFPAWTFNGSVPGPTFRCTEGELLRFRFFNQGTHPHTMHFHGIHAPAMDGVFPQVDPGDGFTYEFVARPFGLHPYHCHAQPLKRHIHKGLYGTLIIDPPGGRPPAREMVMVMNAFDTNFDGENEVYAVNTVAFHYERHPIPVKVGEPQRVYLSNLTEFDPINSFHLHAGMFRVIRTGTSLEPTELTDTVMLCQGERHILEFVLEEPGDYMFHAHQSEFTELGWSGFFRATA